MIGLTVAVVIVLGLVGLLVGTLVFDSEQPSQPLGAGKKGKAGGPVAAGAGKGKGKSKPRAVEPDKELAVGPGARFATIAGALGYIRQHAADYRDDTRSTNVTISVIAENCPESIEIDASDNWPRGVKIVAGGLGTVTLAPKTAGPVIRIKGGAEFLSIEGFTIQAEGKKVAIELEGVLQAVQLKNLVVQGFTETGILGKSASGISVKDALLLENVRLQAGDSQAVGIRLVEGQTDATQRLTVRGGSIIGPMAAGVVFNSKTYDVLIQQTIIHNAAVGIRIDGQSPFLQNTEFSNNTFHQLERGIVFSAMPDSTSNGLVFSRNLFAAIKGPEIVVEKDFKELPFNGMVSVSVPILHNWSTRTVPANPKQGERELMLPNPKGQRTGRLKFLSTDPADDQFLVPSPGVLPRNLGGAGPGLQPYVGARPPG